MKHDKSFLNTRRRFLQALGMGGASALLPWDLLQNKARAADGPPRVIFFTTQHGAPREHWKMNVPGLPSGQDGAASLSSLSEADFSHVFKPLHAMRNKLSIVEGLCMMSAMLDTPGNNHGVARAHLLTSHPADYSNPYATGGGAHPYADAISIDQYIAQQVQNPGLSSVQWGYDNFFGRGWSYSTGPDGSFLPIEDEPSRAFDRLFPNGPPSPSEEPPMLSRRDRIRAQRASVLDLAARQFQRIEPQLGGDDRRKLELHRDQIRALETRLRGNGMAVGGAACDPNLASMNYGSDEERMDLFFRLVAIAFSCDVTRVAALDIGELQPSTFGAPAGNVHEDYAHGSSASAHMHMANYYRVHAEQLANLMSYLDAIPEGNGTVLDNTMIVWLTELATGEHDMGDTLAVVAGGGAGKLTPGQYVRFAKNRPSPCSSYGCQSGADVGPGLQHLFVSALHVMGLSDNAFGQTSGKAIDGSTIDMTGPLPLI